MEVASRNWFALPSVAMLNRDYEGQNCSIARALEVVGERWTLLIIRDLLLGLHRFDELQESLGIARNVLTDRLNRLVDDREPVAIAIKVAPLCPAGDFNHTTFKNDLVNAAHLLGDDSTR